MESIGKNVYIENQYIGVTLGVINQPRGLMLIDAPPAPEDSRMWRASLMGMGDGPERVLINLDSHPDRTLGARAMDCTIIAHEKTVAAFRNRPNTFKAQGDETGASWESIPGLGSIRWAPPEISFTEQLFLHWGGAPILLEGHAGPTRGAIWTILPEQKIVFVGDAVLKGQPPFLAHADLPAWIEALEFLQSKYKGYTVISGRGGVVTPHVVRTQNEMLKRTLEKLEKLGKKRFAADALDKTVEQLLTSFKTPTARRKQYAQRLRYGIHHYYARHYHSSARSAAEE
ncbi:MAG: hypothetical protein HKUEN02_14650 [Anaerolineaceae bacterium]|nr:MAG: hypothetical protein HKUEN02_14650 [Anaerolineaceae bacterium]HRQ31770.1 MBL fold metallo-hydrolase [Anaerolineales bacterium]